MEITVNGRHRSLPEEYKKLTYDNVVFLAFGPPGESVYTVTYFHRKGPSGSLTQGDSVRVKNGMHFTCVQTNKA